MPKSNETHPEQPPITDEDKNLTAHGAERVAGGLPAIYQTMKFGLTRMGAGRTLKTLSLINQKNGFDCPSCAWPDPDDHRSFAEFCENGAKAVSSEATKARVTPEFFARHSVRELASQSDHWLDQQGRITHPMILRPGATHYEPISWEDAFSVIAGELHALPSPDAAAFYTSGRTSNEAAFLYQLFVRLFGTNNLPDCSNMCHESTSIGLRESTGLGKGSVKLEDFDKADSIFIIGQNPGTNHPRMLTTLEKAAKRGCEIVSINPLPEAGLTRFQHPQDPVGILRGGTAIAKLHLPVRINGDVAVLKGIMKAMLEADDRTGGAVLDHLFLKENTEGFSEFAVDIAATAWEDIVGHSGVPRELIEAAAEIAIRSERMIVCWAMGLTQHKNGVANVQTVANFAFLRGNIGRPGAGLCPVRGHSNVQGDRTMGIWERAPDSFLDALGREFKFEPPRAHGFDAVQTALAMHDGRVRVFFGLGGNFLSAMSDTTFVAQGMQRCHLTAHVSTKLNRGHLITGKTALILPCLGRTEKDSSGGSEPSAQQERFVTVEDSMGVVHASRGALEPASPHLLSEVAIVCRLAKATLGDTAKVRWEAMESDYDRIRNAISAVIPGFHDYNRRVREPGGFYLPNGPREGKFTTDSGKAQFKTHPIPRHDLEPDQLLLMTLRSHDQFNTTIYGLDDRYRGIHGGRRVIFLNEADIERLHLTAGQKVDITSHFKGETRIVEAFTVVPYPIPPQCAAGYYPEMNPLAPIRHASDGSNQPAYKSILITVASSAPSAP